ncbi:MAG: asparagine synthase (glutamine-hydrolyzing) [Planctomycetes bacterium]|nr:asparagine synthase (glutamine-hydrolyzing) [Planctomycetota bacterium]MBL7037666.1 asparagine synthase (glutamine-hydrolyzing) [Pirellulaceae bacterium]
MCGIAGVLNFDAETADRVLLERMIAPLRHRGPDDRGVLVDGPAGLAHARLSIIDLDGGRQPMPNEDHSIWVTFNGEIYNYVELRETLRRKGHRMATRSDTEVIVHMYEEFGDRCVEHFNGQWALAIWDRPRRRLFLSRDRMGIRPLYYTTAGGKFLFASEVKSLFVDPDVPRRIDPRGLNQLFTFWSPLPPTTVFDNIFELPPGHNLIVEDGRLRVGQYWQLEYDPTPKDEQHCAEQLLELLLDATRLRLRSDVPVGAYLSGGLDSTVTTALIKQATDAHLRTFSITFEDDEFDESQHQQAAVKSLGTDHQSIRCTSADIGRVFPEVIWHAERPVLRTAPAPLYLLSGLVHDEGYKVVVTGEGADEMLGGYDIFKEAKVRRFWAAQPDSVFRARLLEKLYPYMPGLQAQSLAYRKAFFHVRPDDLANPFFSHLPRWELTSWLKRFFSDDLKSQLTDHDPYAELLARLPDEYADWHPFCQAQYLETTTLLPGYILSSQGDRVAMAGSVEGRFPFLDHRLAEMAARMPVRWKMKGLNEKYILKRAAGHMIPHSIVARKKQPYRAPDAKSFFANGSGTPQHEYVDSLLHSERIREDGIFDPKAVERLVAKARKGRVIGIKDNMTLVGILSTQLVVDQFIREFDACHDRSAASLADQSQYGVGRPQHQIPLPEGKLAGADYAYPVYQPIEE